MAYPHRTFKAAFGLCDWTITTMVNLASTGTTTFLVYQHAYTLFNRFLWLHQAVFRWSQRHWAKQLTLSWQNGFHHSMHVAPLICLLHTSEEQAYLWQLFAVLSGSRNYCSEMKDHKKHHLFYLIFFLPLNLVWGAKLLFWKVKLVLVKFVFLQFQY